MYTTSEVRKIVITTVDNAALMKDNRVVLKELTPPRDQGSNKERNARENLERMPSVENFLIYYDTYQKILHEVGNSIVSVQVKELRFDLNTMSLHWESIKNFYNIRQ
jgi:hypothetical protein